MKVLILTASYGTGHVMVAKAMDEAFRKKGIEPTVIDLVEIGGKTEKIGASFYSFLMRKGHFIWKFYHEKIMPIRKGNSIRFIYKHLHKGKFFQEIEKINPDLIISTMDQASVVASLFKKDHPEVKIATVLTDYIAHPLWVWTNMDYYFVGSSDLKNYLIKQKISENTIFITGIPLRSQFEKLPEKIKARERLGIPKDKKVLLLSSGSFGSAPIHEVVGVLRGRTDIFFIIITSNEKKVPFFAQLLHENDVIGKVIAYTDEIGVVMAASDLFISKAGGVTVAECLAVGLPAIYINNFPGHEIGNATYSSKNGASKIAENSNDLKKAVLELCKDDNDLENMSRASKKLSLPFSSFKILEKVL